MSKDEFWNNEQPLVLIVSVDIDTGKCLFDTYEPEHADGWMNDLRRDFPHMIHYRTNNKAALNQRNERMFGRFHTPITRTTIEETR